MSKAAATPRRASSNPTRGEPTMTDTRALRAEFEPLLISPYGCHLDAARCARGWDTSKESDEDLAEQIARADVWLQMMGPRRTPNRRISSYGLKHVVEGWHRERG